MPEETQLTSQEYAIRLLQMLEDYPDESIKVDSILIVVKMLTRHPVQHAVLFAAGTPYQFGALEFDSAWQAQNFLDQLSEHVRYAVFKDGKFSVFQYPYRSRVVKEWVFVEVKRSPV